MSSATLGRAAMRGGVWVVALRVFTQVLHVVKLVVLARILAPAEFGVASIALLVTAVLQMVTETGFENALIQRDDDVRGYLDSAWTMLVVRGLAIGAGLLLAAPLAETFFRVAGSTDVVRGMAVAVMIDGFLNIGTVFFKKDLEFKRFAMLESTGLIADFVVSIAAALILGNAWALVLGRIMQALFRTGTSYWVSSYRPRFDFDLSRAGELFRFGKWMLGSGVLVFAITQGDNMVVGRVLGASALGLYTMAYRFSCLPATEITSMLSQVSFPYYSKVQGDRAALARAYGRVLSVISVASFLLAASVFVLAPDAVPVVMGEKWVPMVGAIEVLVWFGVARGLASSMSPLFMSIGEPRQVATQQFWQVLIMFALIYPLTVRYNIVGTAWAVAIAAGVMFIARIARVSRILGWKQWEYYKRLLVPSAASAVAIGLVSVMRSTLPIENSILGLAGMTAAFLIAFGVSILAGDRILGLELAGTARTLFGEVVRRKSRLPDAAEQLLENEPVGKETMREEGA